MSNRLYIDTVHIRYPRKEPRETRESFGFHIGDDYDQFEVLDHGSEAELPDTLEGILRHCRSAGHAKVWELFEQHASMEKGVQFDGLHIQAEELRTLLDAIGEEEDERHG